MSRPRTISDEEILSTARELFVQHGAKLSTTVIAEQLGVSQAALFKRFGTKDKLLIAALRPPENIEWINAAKDGPAPDREIREQLYEIGDLLATFFEKILPCMATLRSGGIDPADLLKGMDVPPPVLGNRVLTAWVTRAVEQGRMSKNVNASAFAHAFIGGLQFPVFLSYLAPGETHGASKHYVRDLVDTLLGNLLEDS